MDCRVVAYMHMPLLLMPHINSGVCFGVSQGSLACHGVVHLSDSLLSAFANCIRKCMLHWYLDGGLVVVVMSSFFNMLAWENDIVFKFLTSCDFWFLWKITVLGSMNLHKKEE